MSVKNSAGATTRRTVLTSAATAASFVLCSSAQAQHASGPLQFGQGRKRADVARSIQTLPDQLTENLEIAPKVEALALGPGVMDDL